MKNPFQWTIFIFATLLFAGATMMAGVSIKLDLILLIDRQVDPDDPYGVIQPFNSETLLVQFNLFLTGVYIATNFIADLLIVSFMQFFSRRGITHCVTHLALPPVFCLGPQSLDYQYSFLNIPRFYWSALSVFFVLANSLKEYLTACSIIVEYQSTAETPVTFSFAISYFCLSVAFTIISTVLIIVHLMAGRRVAQNVLGTSYNAPYVSIAAMIIESAALYSIVGIFFIVFLVIEYSVHGINVLMPMFGQAMVR